MGHNVSAAKYLTCICGKECKGRAALANHGSVCEMETARSWAFTRAIELGKTPLSTSDFVAWWGRGWRPKMDA